MRKVILLIKIPFKVSNILNMGFASVLVAAITIFTVLITLQAELVRYYDSAYGLSAPVQLSLASPISLTKARQAVQEFKEKTGCNGVIIPGKQQKVDGKFYWNRETFDAIFSSFTTTKRSSVNKEIDVYALFIEPIIYPLRVQIEEIGFDDVVNFIESRPGFLVPDGQRWDTELPALISDPATQNELGEYTYDPDDHTFYLEEDELEEYEENDPALEIARVRSDNRKRLIAELVERHLPFPQVFQFNDLIYKEERESEENIKLNDTVKLHYLLFGSVGTDVSPSYIAQPLSDMIFHRKSQYQAISIVSNQLAYNFNIIASYRILADEGSYARKRIITRYNDLLSAEQNQDVNTFWLKDVSVTEQKKFLQKLGDGGGKDVIASFHGASFSSLERKKSQAVLGIFGLGGIFFVIFFLISLTFFSKFYILAKQTFLTLKGFGANIFAILAAYGSLLFIIAAGLAYILHRGLYIVLNKSLHTYYYAQTSPPVFQFVIVTGVSFLLFYSGILICYFSISKGMDR